MRIAKSYSFDAAHRLWRQDWNEEQNQITFGKCSRLHGHTYTLRVGVFGGIDSVSGMVVNYYDIDALVKPFIDDNLDHHFLGTPLVGEQSTPTFSYMLTTAENLSIAIAKALVAKMRNTGIFTGVDLDFVEVSETPKTVARYDNDAAI